MTRNSPRSRNAAERSAIILVGGQSRRMGRPKAALPFGDATILDRLLSELRPSFAELIVLAAPFGAVPAPIVNVLARWKEVVRLMHDPEAFAGPAPALARGLRAAAHATAFVCSCDLPFLRTPVALKLCDMLQDFDAAVPVVAQRQQPLCAAYRTAVADLIESAADEGEARLTVITTRLNTRLIDADTLRKIDPDLRSFLNVNSPGDYARALALARS